MKKCMIYIHGKGGNAGEAAYYETLFPEYTIIGFDYLAQTPWEAMTEFMNFFTQTARKYEHIVLVANSIGAFFAMHALQDKSITEAYFISPIVNMENLIKQMLSWANVSEEELQQKGMISTDFGETLSWEYLTWVRKHPVKWRVPTHILYGSNDNLQSLNDIKTFAAKSSADVTVMDGGEHWFHTEEQMRFLSDWIKNIKS